MKTVNELLDIARQCEGYEEFDLALKYYREVLKLSPGLQTAEMGIERARNELAKLVYFTTPASFKLVEGRLELRKGELVFVSITGTETEYLLEEIDNFGIKLGRLTFDYCGMPHEGYSCRGAKKWINMLTEAKEGGYPRIGNGGLTSLEKYIHDNYSREQKEEAIAYFMDMSGCNSSEARIAVHRILG